MTIDAKIMAAMGWSPDCRVQRTDRAIWHAARAEAQGEKE